MRAPRPFFARGPAACAALLAALAAALAPVSAEARPTLEETVDFTRVELGALCSDAARSGIEALDQLTVGGGRNCQVMLEPGRLKVSIRQRGAAQSAGSYARLSLDVAFDRDSAFVCGPEGKDGRSTLFIACEFANGADGFPCAERVVSVARPGQEDYAATQRLAAASILRTDEQSCGVVARALSYISERSARTTRETVRDFFQR